MVGDSASVLDGAEGAEVLGGEVRDVLAVVDAHHGEHGDDAVGVQEATSRLGLSNDLLERLGLVVGGPVSPQSDPSRGQHPVVGRSDGVDHDQSVDLSLIHIYADPTQGNPHAEAIRASASALEALPSITAATLTEWVTTHPEGVYTLGLVVGLSQEKLKNLLRAEFGTTSWTIVALSLIHI